MLLVGIGARGPVRGQELEDVSAPGPEHEVLAWLAGEWTVSVEGRAEPIGRAVGTVRLERRFLEMELWLTAGPIGHAIYTFGFDRRHDVYTVSASDDTGTYVIHAKGARDGNAISMYGTDDDPGMTRMGLTKEFDIVLELIDPDRIAISTLFVDNRTDARTEIPFLRYELWRTPA
jgi:hypothetical protein